MTNDEYIDNILSETQTFNPIKFNEYIINTYGDKLKGFLYIPDKNSFFFNVKKGGYIKYVNLNNILKSGGILINVDQLENDTILTVKYGQNNFLKISFNKNHIYYKNHTTSSDKLKALFMDMVNKFE
jgi:glutaredoxin-related protein